MQPFQNRRSCSACPHAGRHARLVYPPATAAWGGRQPPPRARRVFVNAALSGVQQRNLAAAWGRPVMDRVGLIIAIFGQRARTREARLQARRPRLALLQTRGGVAARRGPRWPARVGEADLRCSARLGSERRDPLQGAC